jgi:hypothetical protein
MTAFRYGLFTATALSVYEVLTAYVNFGVMGSPDVLNVFILALGILGAIGHYHRRLRHPLPYWTGTSLGMLTSMVGMVGYAVFVFCYYSFVDPAQLRQAIHLPRADEPNGLEIAATTIIEGFMYGLIITLTVMQYYTIGRTDKDFDEAYE